MILSSQLPSVVTATTPAARCLPCPRTHLVLTDCFLSASKYADDKTGKFDPEAKTDRQNPGGGQSVLEVCRAGGLAIFQ